MKQRDFHRKVRVVYRAMRKLYGKEKVQDECLRVFKVVYPFYYKAKNGEDIRFDEKARERMNKIFLSWNAEDGSEFARLLALVTDGMTTIMTRDEFVQFCDDILPVVMRIRKLTPRECFRLMGVDDADIDKIQAYPYETLIEHPAYSKEERFRGMTDKEKRAAMKRSISNSAQYKLAGNSIVVDVLFHLFRKLFVEPEPDMVKGEAIQLALF